MLVLKENSSYNVEIDIQDSGPGISSSGRLLQQTTLFFFSSRRF
jgi:hypothetical protein